MQTIQFELDRTGGKIKSEAGMMVKKEGAREIHEIREFCIDDTFAIFLKEEGKNIPYFAGKISDITKFQWYIGATRSSSLNIKNTRKFVQFACILQRNII